MKLILNGLLSILMLSTTWAQEGSNEDFERIGIAGEAGLYYKL